MGYKPSGDLVTKDGRTSQFTVAGFTDTHVAHLDDQNIQAQKALMVIDLSDTTNWPHSNTGHIKVEYLILEIDPDGSFLGEVKLGFLKSVSSTSGNFHQVIDIDMARKSDLFVEVIDFGSHGLDLESDHVFGPIEVDNTLFQTDVNLLGPSGSTAYPPSDGDLVLLVEVSAGAVDISLTAGYETVP